MNNIFRSSTSNQPDTFDAEEYNKHIKYFLDNEVSAIVYNLSEDELHNFFEMCQKYPAIINKVFLLPGDPLINYIMYGNEFYDALKNPHDGIDYTPSYIVKQYKDWAKANNIPEPKDMVAEEGIDITPMVEFQNNL